MSEAGQWTVGIVSDDPLQRRRLQDAAARFGLAPGFCGEPERLFALSPVPAVDLWLVVMENEDADATLMDFLLERSEAPMLFGLDPAPKPGQSQYVSWERRLLGKLEQSLGPLEQLDNENSLEQLDQTAPAHIQDLPHWITPAAPGTPAEYIWILGASLGGPAAVKAFLDCLPAGLPVAFVYAQHIDGNFTEVLTRVLGRHAHYQLKRAEAGTTLKTGEVVLLPVEQEWTLDDQGELVEKANPWPGPYGPSIDQVLLNVGDHYGDRCNAILFSGMGNDGAVAAPLLKAYGSQIWAQDSASCGNSSMPDSVVATGCVSFVGNPEQLARQLVKTLEETCLLKRKHQRDSA